MVITIDGPAGAGKSTIASRLAHRLGYRFLDTGAMYRAVTWLAMHNEISWDDVDSLVRLAANAKLVLRENQVTVDGQDVTEAIRSRDVTQHVRFVADQPLVREQLVRQQRAICAAGNYVTEGRDQGTVAFPNAEVKFFLTASPYQRALRRQQQLQGKGIAADFDELLAEQEERDRRDQSRPVGPLQKPKDAIEVVTDELSIDEVVDALAQHVQRLTTSAPAESTPSSTIEETIQEDLGLDR